MLTYGFIGIGQVGGLFTDASKEFGYPSLAVNTANVDLSILTKLDKHEKVHCIGFGGAGKNRDIGKEAFLTHEEMLKEKVQRSFEDCQVIFPVFAAGGGTGSGMGPLLIQALTEWFEDKVIAPILFLPEKSESPRAKMNALECFSELSMIDDIGATFIIDNQKVMELNRSYPLKIKHATARKEILTQLHYFNQMTEKPSHLSNLDEMDLLTTLSERGAAIFTGIPLDESDAKHVGKLSERLLKAVEFSIFAKTDTRGISKASLLMELSPAMTTDLKGEQVLQEIGMPLEIFTGIYETCEGAKIHTCLTGLPFPSALIGEMEEDIRTKEEKLQKTLTFARTQSFDVKSSWTNSLKRERKIKL